MPNRPEWLRKPDDYDRFTWPPGRSDVAALIALTMLVIASLNQQWGLAGAALALTVAAIEWPTLEWGKVKVSPTGDLEAEAARRRVGASYRLQGPVQAPGVEGRYGVEDKDD